MGTSCRFCDATNDVSQYRFWLVVRMTSKPFPMAEKLSSLVFPTRLWAEEEDLGLGTQPRISTSTRDMDGGWRTACPSEYSEELYALAQRPTPRATDRIRGGVQSSDPIQYEEVVALSWTALGPTRRGDREIDLGPVAREPESLEACLQPRSAAVANSCLQSSHRI
ncbi:hypothetical protein VTN96DRAFT_8099 [Rasamsonia emersonii]